MSITRQEVEHVARLAMLELDEAELPRLAEQIARIMDYVDQLQALEPEPAVAPYRGGPSRAPLRVDEVRPEPLARTPRDLAPEMLDGFFVVPRLGHLEGE